MASIFEDDNSKMPKDTMRWLEWNLSRTLLFLAENNLLEVNGFWQSHGANLFLRLMQSSQEDVQERATKGLAAFIYVGDDYEACVYHERAEAVMHDGGTPILLKLAKSWKESFQAEAASAVANLLSIATNEFTIPGASHAKHHASLMHNAGDMGNLRSAAAAMRISSKATFLAKIVLSFVRGVAARGLFSRVYTSDQDMNPRVRQRVDEDGTDMDRRVRQRIDEDVAPKVQESVDWTSMTYDPMLHIFTLLDSRDRASLASTLAASLENRCADLQRVRFNGVDSADALVSLKEKNLREISVERCENVTDATLSMIVARHEALESLQLGPGFGERITSEAIKIITIFCTKLKTLRLSGMRDVSSEAITSLAEHCPQLSDVGFFDCLNINEEALGQVVSLRYLSVTGTANINWRVAAERWEKLPNLTALDVSSTSIDHMAVSRLFKSSQSLEVVCALNCPMLEEHDGADLNPDRFKGKLLIAMFNNTLNGIASIFEDDNSKMPRDTMRWLEWNLSRTLLFLAENNLLELNGFWQSHGPKLFLRLMQSSQEDVQERETKGLAASSMWVMITKLVYTTKEPKRLCVMEAP
ncbi:hypothetical protein Bca101_021745 [Brassica carinata]